MKKVKFFSIQYKFIILMVSALLTVELIIGSFAIITTDMLSKDKNNRIMQEICDKQVGRLNDQLDRVSNSVDIIDYYVKKNISTVDQIRNPQDRRKIIDNILAFSLNISDHTEGAMAVYLRLDLKFGKENAGFFYSKKRNSTTFTYEPLTDLSIYSEDDVEHVGWFYQPKRAGRPIWMSPYYNKNVDVEMISYVIPLYIQEEFVGVIGMDIDFSLFVDLAAEGIALDNEKANLVDIFNNVIYYNDIVNNNKAVRLEQLPEELHEILKKKSSKSEVLDIEYNNVKYKMIFDSLKTNMRYVICYPLSEVNKERNTLFYEIIVIMAVLIVVFVVFTVYITKYIVKPLKKLDEAVGRIASGDMDIILESKTSDEVGTLTKSINIMARQLKDYVSEINTRAYQDALTGVKNRSFYLEYIKKLNSELEKDYALIVFDVNNLKFVNDNYGHEEGDILIKMASRYICNYFDHSPVFRIGGDEFVCILNGKDYNNRHEIIGNFEENMHKEKMDRPPFMELSVAYGLAEFSEGSTYDDIFRVADKRMYDKKAIMKKKRPI